MVEMNHLVRGQTKYRDYGNDRTYNTDDDILTYYIFDYAGRTVNAYSTDNEGKLVGASNAVYSGTGTTEKSNNRTLKTATVGMAAMNELRNHSFEASSPAWTRSGHEHGGSDDDGNGSGPNRRKGVQGMDPTWKEQHRVGDPDHRPAVRRGGVHPVGVCEYVPVYVILRRRGVPEGDGIGNPGFGAEE